VASICIPLMRVRPSTLSCTYGHLYVIAEEMSVYVLCPF
jgi:hypothetical protein